jgi:hypothetical protein
MSYWIDIDKAVEAMGADYVFSYKPTPSVFAGDAYEAVSAQGDLKKLLEKARGTRIEIIMKDISTVRGEPQRLWEWVAMASRMAEEAGA